MQSVKDWKNTKNTKIQIALLDVMEKYKKNTKIQSVFFVFYLYFFRISFDFVFFLNTKKIQTYECNCSKIHNTEKIRINNFKNTKYKKNTNPKFQKYKIQRKDKFKNKPESQPRVHFWKSGTKIQKKYKTNQLYFPNPAVLILYFWVVFFSYFFLYF